MCFLVEYYTLQNILEKSLDKPLFLEQKINPCVFRKTVKKEEGGDRESTINLFGTK